MISLIWRLRKFVALWRVCLWTDAKRRSDGWALLRTCWNAIDIVRHLHRPLAVIRRQGATHYALTVMRRLEAGQSVTDMDDWRTWKLSDKGLRL